MYLIFEEVILILTHTHTHIYIYIYNWTLFLKNKNYLFIFGISNKHTITKYVFLFYLVFSMQDFSSAFNFKNGNVKNKLNTNLATCNLQLASNHQLRLIWQKKKKRVWAYLAVECKSGQKLCCCKWVVMMNLC